MKILFVINNGSATYLEYEHTGILNAPKRRSVEIELTQLQIEQLNLKQVGTNCGKVLFETIESISLTE